MIQPDVPPRLAEIQTKTPNPDCKGDRRDCIQERSDWVDQYRSELEKECSARAAQVESLLFGGDFEAIIDWIEQWQRENEGHNSKAKRYRQALSEYRQVRFKERMKSYGQTLNKLTNRASTAVIGDGSGADHSQPIGDFSIMTRTISTSVKTLGYYVSLPEHIEEEFGSHFENLSKSEQYTLLATLAGYMAALAHPDDYSTQSLRDIKNDVSGYLPGALADLLSEIEEKERQCNGTILALSEALVLNIHYTHVEEE